MSDSCVLYFGQYTCLPVLLNEEGHNLEGVNIPAELGVSLQSTFLICVSIQF